MNFLKCFLVPKNIPSLIWERFRQSELMILEFLTTKLSTFLRFWNSCKIALREAILMISKAVWSSSKVFFRISTFRNAVYYRYMIKQYKMMNAIISVIWQVWCVISLWIILVSSNTSLRSGCTNTVRVLPSCKGLSYMCSFSAGHGNRTHPILVGYAQRVRAAESGNRIPWPLRVALVSTAQHSLSK